MGQEIGAEILHRVLACEWVSNGVPYHQGGTLQPDAARRTEVCVRASRFLHSSEQGYGSGPDER